MKKLIVNLCPTGMIPTKQLTPYVPVSPEEIITDVLSCAKIGVSMVHLHARGTDEKPTYKKEVYTEIISGIRNERPDLIIVVSTSGRNFNEFEKRSEALDLKGDLKPDMASLTLSSLNFPKCASSNSPDMIIKLADKMQQNGIKPELEVFDLGMVNYAEYLISKGLLEPPYYFNIILGNIATAQAKMQHLGLIVSELPDNSIWSVGGIGISQKNMNIFGIIAGDGVRIGLEDNIWFDDDKAMLTTNSLLIDRIVKIAELAGRQIATPDETRELLGLSKFVHSCY